ncbi:hypothetical protein [Novosphingobium sp. ST904]|uniref:hypothetical protein n=1 Tax=Novosphingobium sp. ST904 TaxID=1684385 RepID=UPI0006C89269|nr:hypothetical protein [Novosphingobium sp. ST904]KPH66021.1 hypothetical protein ADT71_08630 [Novosphingobium sp. ST904]TCM33769.1 hypothetical protein EDF59_11985 [Novosphingobium sp. ST904]
MTDAPLSLYFDIPKGEHVDLEVVARSAIEWVAIIKDIGAAVAPGVDFDVELIQTEEGSLWLSNAVKALKTGDRKALGAIVSAVLAFFAMGPALHLQADSGNKILEFLGHKDFAEISDKDKQDIADRVVKAMQETDVLARQHNLVQEAKRDERVKAIGIDRSPRQGGPQVIIRRQDFDSYALPAPTKVHPSEKKTEVQTSVRVKILRASLKEGDLKPRWKFGEGESTWSADIEDSEFVEALNAQQTGLPLAVGQLMVVDVAIDRKMIDGAWEEANRRIVRVIHPSVERRQRSLDLGR